MVRGHIWKFPDCVSIEMYVYLLLVVFVFGVVPFWIYVRVLFLLPLLEVLLQLGLELPVSLNSRDIMESLPS